MKVALTIAALLALIMTGCQRPAYERNFDSRWMPLVCDGTRAKCAPYLMPVRHIESPVKTRDC